MSRRRKENKKRKNDGFIFPVPFASILFLVGLLALAYLWVCGQSEALGKRIKILEVQKTEIRERRYNEECKWAYLKSPRNIERALRRYGLVMTWPDKDRVVELPVSACRSDGNTLNGKTHAERAVMKVAMND